ncbi:hypothetical protein BKA83DRAFT_4498474 [Pisolithus microcarpus]|nr:hypothetical protein BKA83DRAFT_4498474 [Pisolithus microcarpus]
MAFTERAATGPRRSFGGSLRGIPATITSEFADIGIGSGIEELPEVLPLQSATTTSTDRGAQADQEEFRAASPKDAMPEPDPMAAADVPLRFIRATGAGGCYTSGSFTA